MTITANLADGRVLNFPDGTDQTVIQNTVKKMVSGQQDQLNVAGGTEDFLTRTKRIRGQTDLKSLLTESDQSDIPEDFKQLAKEQGFLKSGAISTGRGLFKVSRALGFSDPEDETEKLAFRALGEEQPIATTVGEAVGESLPFLPVGGPISRIASTPVRALAAGATGAVEGGLIRRGEGGTESEQISGAGLGGAIAGGLEASMPIIGSIGGKLIKRYLKRTPKGSVLDATGLPTKELEEALQVSGLEFGDLKDAAIELLSQQNPGVVPEQAARAARFKDVNIPATKGDITQDFAQQANEARLFESAADTLSEPLRGLRLQQSQGLTGNLEKLIEKSGVPENIGEGLKDALSGRKALLQKKKNALYKAAANNAENVESLPFPVVGIENAIPDQRTISRIGRIQGNQTEPIMDLLAEFGIDTSEQAAKRLKDKGIELEQLSLQNFDEFRMALNQIERADQTGASSVIIGPIRDALDNEAENIADVLQKAGITDENVIGPLKEARKTVRQLKTEFSPESITGKLIGAKRDGVTPIIESSQVFKNIVGTNKPIELLERTITSLKKAGPKGIQSIGDLQAATVLDLIESAFKAETRKVQGAKTFGTVAFNKRLAQIGDDKLKLIFSTNPGLLKELKKVSDVAKDLTPPSGAVPKGSASVILDSMNKLGMMTVLGKVPGGGLFVEAITKLSEGRATRGAVKKALDATPDSKKVISLIESELPSLAVAFGLTGLKEDENK